MVRLTATIVGVLSVFGGLRPFAQAPTAMPSPERLYAAFAAGDTTIVARSVRRAADYRAIRDDLQRLIASWKRPVPSADGTPERWLPSRPAFVFDVGIAITPFEWTESVRLFEAARDLTVLRPNGPAAARPDDADRFEVILHRAALSMVSAFPGDAGRYLNSIDGRVAALRRLPGGGALVGRLILARGMVAETATRTLMTDLNLSETGVADEPAVVSRTQGRQSAAARERDARERLQAAAAAYATAAALPSVASEALVRRGFVLHRLGDSSHALEALARGLQAATDPDVRYWGELFQGRVFQATGRLPQARDAYARATAVVPSGQTAAIALASVLLMQNDREQAERWANAARTGRLGDPWWIYWSADSRFLETLVRDMRGARP